MLPQQHILTVLAALLIVGSFPGEVQAQAVLHTYEARVESADPDNSPKALFSAIVDEYSTADVTHDRNTGILTITTSFSIEQHWLASVAEQAGFTLTGLWCDGVDIFRGEVEPEGVDGAAPAPPIPANATPRDEN